MPTLKVVLDACVLYPAALRDTLLRAARTGFYDPYWSRQILEEVRRNLIQERLSLEQWHHLQERLTTAFPAALITQHEHLIATMTNDPKDRHVMAAAVTAGAQIIVTDNLRDFPRAALAPFGLEAQSSDAFLTHLFYQDPTQMAEVIVKQASQLRSPPKTVPDVLEILAIHAPSFTAHIRAHLKY